MFGLWRGTKMSGVYLGARPDSGRAPKNAPKLGGRLDSGRAGAGRARPDISGRLGLWVWGPCANKYMTPRAFFAPPGLG